MNKTKLSTVLNTVQTAVTKHSPEILTGIGIAGMITTTVLAVTETPKAIRLLEQAEKEKGEKLTASDKVKACWKCYIPAAVTGTVSVACLIGASSVNVRRNTALATAYKLSETALSDYKEKVVETIGEKKEQAVKDAIAKDKVTNNPPVQRDIIVTGNGESLCYDVTFGRYFKSSIESLKKIENELNRRMRNEMHISLNEFYYEVGLDDVAAGHDLGWDIDNGYIELDFSSQLTPDGTPCIVISFANPPRYDFR